MLDLAPLLAGDRRALARWLTQIENDAPEAAAALAELFKHTGQTHRVGVTGPPGCGKSALVTSLARVWRRQNLTVAILAVDPSSPFTGGALLGDRVRMRDLAGDPGVFIRSMASRGELGGLARATAAMLTALEAAGFDKILVETVGAGQTEVEIARTAHTVLVVEAPGLGDGVQAIKAGVLEIADGLVVNKADLPGAEAAAQALRSALEWAPAANVWTPPVLLTQALRGEGVAALAEVVDRHLTHLRTTGEWQQRERARLQHELENRLRHWLLEKWLARVGSGQLQALVQRLEAREIDPDTAAQTVAQQLDG
jgi:LAO/AO transport system kinase